MALGDFDSNQSSLEFGQSLLADKDRRDKKARKRQKKIKNVGYLLGAVGVADMFLAKKANKKVELFKENLTAEKTNALSAFTTSKQFYDDQLKKYYTEDPSIDFEDSNTWKEGSSLWGAISGDMATQIKENYNFGRIYDEDTGSYKIMEDTVYKDFIHERDRRTKNAIEALRVKYGLHKENLSTTSDKISSRYDNLIKEGTRDILSAKNTSSIRKLLGKLKMFDEIDPALVQIEGGAIGGLKETTLFLDQDTVNEYLQKAEANKQAYKNYLIERKQLSPDLEIREVTPTAEEAGKKGNTVQFESILQRNPTVFDVINRRYAQIDQTGNIASPFDTSNQVGAPFARSPNSKTQRDLVPNKEMELFDLIEIDGKKILYNLSDENGNRISFSSMFSDKMDIGQYEDGTDIRDTVNRPQQKWFFNEVATRMDAALEKQKLKLRQGQTDIDPGTLNKQIIEPEATEELLARTIKGVVDDHVFYDDDGKLQLEGMLTEEEILSSAGGQQFNDDRIVSDLAEDIFYDKESTMSEKREAFATQQDYYKSINRDDLADLLVEKYDALMDTIKINQTSGPEQFSENIISSVKESEINKQISRYQYNPEKLLELGILDEALQSDILTTEQKQNYQKFINNIKVASNE